MKQKIVSLALFVALLAFSVGSFTSCKDYDDDIKDLQEQINGLSGMKTDLDKAIADVKASADAAKVSADAAKAAADAAAKVAQEGGTAAAAAKAAADAAAKVANEAKGAADAAAAAASAAAAQGKTAQEAAEAAKKVAETAKTTADEAKVKADALEKDLTALAERVKTLEEQKNVSPEELKALEDQVAAALAKVEAFVGKRLTSVTLVPKDYVNGIEAISIKSLQYNPQSFIKNHKEKTFTTKGSTITRVVDAGSTIVEFRVSPRFVKAADLGTPYFNAWVANNQMTRSVEAGNAGIDKPIAPVKGQELDITEDGILKLKVTKTVGKSIAHTTNADKTNETFYVASLAIPIAEQHWTDAEKASREVPTVTSEPYRLTEVVDVPRIKSTIALPEIAKAFDGTTGAEITAAPFHYYPYALDKDSMPVHFSDSTILYNSKVNELIDKTVDWEAGIDLLTLVTVCTEADHATLENYKDYGLEFRFEVATEKYLQGANKTDQQRFANVKGSMLTSEVYTIGGVTQTAIGREPIIRASLINTLKNNELVDQRYIKIKWGKETPEMTLPTHNFKDQYVSCTDLVNLFGTQEMNEKIYRQVEEKYGISKAQFHSIYTGLEITNLVKGTATYLIKDGVAQNVAGNTVSFSTTETPDKDVQFYMVPDADDNTSYNLVWEMSPKAVGKITPKAKETYTISIVFKDLTVGSGWGDIHMDFTLDVLIPTQSFNYQGTYWKNGQGQGVFNVNPIVYNSKVHGDVDAIAPEHLSHISADLVNGYLYGKTKLKPANLAQFIQMIRGCADVKFVFDQTRFSKYSHLAGYSVDKDTRTSLWKKANPATITDFAYIQPDVAVAATIENKFGADATENQNKNNLPWYDYAEAIGTGVNEASAVLRLHEADEKNGTDPAKALVGKAVPVNLEVSYNEYNTVAVQSFEVFFIDPLKVDGTIKDPFTDAEVNGSFTDVETGFGFTDWNGYKVGQKAPSAAEKDRYAKHLFQYYVVKEVTFDVEKAKSSLKLVGDTYIHDDKTKDGNLPTNRSLKQVTMNGEVVEKDWTAVLSNPTHLGYFNNDGTPVNVNYNIFVDVSVGYKWGVLKQPSVQIKVNKAEGTPSGR